MNRREFIGSSALAVSFAAIAADEKTTDGGYAEVSYANRNLGDEPLLPAGAESSRRFASKCVGCGLCAAACPSKCLTPSTKLSRLGRVELDYRYGWCKPDCNECAKMCPAGALLPTTPARKRITHIGKAIWRADKCLRTTEGVKCNACVKHCPVKAVKLVGNIPVVDGLACIGCGACEHYCPVRPETAIKVSAFEAHREATPMTEADLIAEMKAQLMAGKAAVIAHEGIITQMLEGRGVAPILSALAKNPNVYKGAIVADKIVGKAAAAIYVVGGATKVYAPVMSKDAEALLTKNGIVALCDESVAMINNREKTGCCPMDSLIGEETDPKAMVKKLQNANLN